MVKATAKRTKLLLFDLNCPHDLSLFVSDCATNLFSFRHPHAPALNPQRTPDICSLHLQLACHASRFVAVKCYPTAL